MLSNPYKSWPLLAFLLSSGLLLGALAFEHIGGLAPCQMCYWQRHAHKAVIFISGLALIYQYGLKKEQHIRTFNLLIGLAFLVSFGLAFWHTGVELKWWPGPKTCSAIQTGKVITGEDIFKALDGKVKLPSCGDVPWSLFGLSMAAYNAILSLGAAVLSFIFVRKG
ncbi:MAG TPA: disulfide bond formation protein B [Hellea balneolensis]|uniref:Disulfide bond formation protein B n=1 Tax=Hellea balneolensis TaxID=287478 RepID=A0A7C5R1N7_9PROT|nr:disulfide bond formation protein B [Hellea balneolensis]